MTTIETQKTEINSPAEKVFAFLSDFTQYAKIMPDQVVNWQSTADECTFAIKNMATVGMKIVERIPPGEVRIVSGDKVPFKFNLKGLIEVKTESASVAQFVFESDLNPMIKMMIEKPLGNLFNFMIKKLKDVLESNG